MQIGKLFNKIPYNVRDEENDYKDIFYVEEILNTFMFKHDLNIKNIINVLSNNRDNISHFHIILNKSISMEHLCFPYENENIEFTFEEYKEAKTKTTYINSFMFLETFKHLDEKELIDVFENFIGCDGNKLFISIPKNSLKLFQPKCKHYQYRKTLIEKKDIIENIATSLNINYENLYDNLSPNIIKQVCKDLNITYKTLSSELGYKPDTINKAASTGKISEQLLKVTNLYLENLRLKEELEDFEVIKQTLKNVMV